MKQPSEEETGYPGYLPRKVYIILIGKESIFIRDLKRRKTDDNKVLRINYY